MKNILAFAAILTIAMFGCNRADTPYYPIDATTKSLFNWQVGSYWIMQDSATAQVDSFYVISYRTSKQFGSYVNNESLHIDLTEANTLNPTDSMPWSIKMGELGDYSNLKLGNYQFNNRDSAFSWMSFFYQIPYSDIALAFNGISYSHVYYNSTAFYVSIATGYLSIGLNKESGFIYIKDIRPNYQRTWFLLRKHLVAAP